MDDMLPDIEGIKENSVLDDELPDVDTEIKEQRSGLHDAITLDELNERIRLLVVRREMKDSLKERLEKMQAEFEASTSDLRWAIQSSKIDVAEAQGDVLQALQQLELDGYKTKTNTISRKKSVRYDVVDEPALIAALYENNLAKEYVTETVKPEVKGIFDQMELPGVNKVETEFISVLNRKQE